MISYVSVQSSGPTGTAKAIVSKVLQSIVDNKTTERQDNSSKHKQNCDQYQT